MGCDIPLTDILEANASRIAFGCYLDPKIKKIKNPQQGIVSSNNGDPTNTFL
jgi:hypothetical protein